jgi:hypothetical protein
MKSASFTSISLASSLHPFGTDVQVRYLVDSQSIQVILPNRTDTFTIDELIFPDTAYTATFQRKNGSGQIVRTLSIRTPLVSGVPLTYVRWGSYADTENFATGTLAQFAFGIETADNDMPRTGSATFSTVASGIVIAPVEGGGSTGYYNLLGDGATFSANFATMSVDTSIHLLTNGGLPTLPAIDRDFGTVAGTGVIASTGPGFAGTFTTAGFTGNFTGAFFGPSALEMGYNFTGSSTDGFSVIGSVFGVQQPPP